MKVAKEMKGKTLSVCGALATGLMAGVAQAQDLFIYPNEGQSTEQQDKDQFECYGWAKQSSGFDPLKPPQPSPAPRSQQPTASVGRGLATGAVAGAMVGGIANNKWGKGAAIGAVTGGVIGGIRRRDQQSQQAQSQARWSQQYQAELARQRQDYNRAYSACLEGRGYTVR